MNTYDVCIVGAGVVGCAFARELMQRRWETPLRVVVIEQHAGVAEETSGRNSGVLHSGIHEQPRSLKGQLAREGTGLAVSYALEHGIPMLRTGMVVAISWEDVRRGLWREVSTLWRLLSNARKTNIRISFVTPSGLRTLEPNLRSCCGIVIPDVAVIDPLVFVQSLRTDSEAAGAVFAFNNRVIGIDEDASAYIVTTDRQRLRAACLINAAGLYSDDIAALALRYKKYNICPVRGEYYEVTSPEKKSLIGRLVYPALPPQATGKGIHFSPRPNGQLFLGPNEMAIQDKTDYTSRKTPPSVFVEALRKFLPALEEGDLEWSYSGIRPCVMTGTECKSDFIIAVDNESPPLVNLVGIESPGLSAALAIANHVAELHCVQKRFNPSRVRSPSVHDARMC